MSLNIPEIANVWLPLSRASYDPTLASLPPGWTILSLIGPEQFGFSAINGAGVRVTVVRGTELEPVPNPDNGLASKNIEWYEDVDFAPTPAKLPGAPGIDWGWVHRGFQEAYWRIRDTMHPVPGVQVTREVVIGHSLGVPIACLFAAEHHCLDPEVYGFNGPRTGQHNFATPFDQRIPSFLRIENFLDPVHHLAPESLSYVHAGTALTVYSRFSANVHYLHGLDAIEEGLRKQIV